MGAEASRTSTSRTSTSSIEWSRAINEFRSEDQRNVHLREERLRVRNKQLEDEQIRERRRLAEEKLRNQTPWHELNRLTTVSLPSYPSNSPINALEQCETPPTYASVIEEAEVQARKEEEAAARKAEQNRLFAEAVQRKNKALKKVEEEFMRETLEIQTKTIFSTGLSAQDKGMIELETESSSQTNSEAAGSRRTRTLEPSARELQEIFERNEEANRRHERFERMGDASRLSRMSNEQAQKWICKALEDCAWDCCGTEEDRDRFARRWKGNGSELYALFAFKKNERRLTSLFKIFMNMFVVYHLTFLFDQLYQCSYGFNIPSRS